MESLARLERETGDPGADRAHPDAVQLIEDLFRVRGAPLEVAALARLPRLDADEDHADAGFHDGLPSVLPGEARDVVDGAEDREIDFFQAGGIIGDAGAQLEQVIGKAEVILVDQVKLPDRTGGVA